jgi:Ca2+-binding EF-hand superfamily protein
MKTYITLNKNTPAKMNIRRRPIDTAITPLTGLAIVVISLAVTATTQALNFGTFVDRASGGAIKLPSVNVPKFVERTTGGKVDIDKFVDRASGGRLTPNSFSNAFKFMTGQGSIDFIKFVDRTTGGKVDVDKFVDRASGGRLKGKAIQDAIDTATGKKSVDFVKFFDRASGGTIDVDKFVDRASGGRFDAKALETAYKVMTGQEKADFAKFLDSVSGGAIDLDKFVDRASGGKLDAAALQNAIEGSALQELTKVVEREVLHSQDPKAAALKQLDAAVAEAGKDLVTAEQTIQAAEFNLAEAAIAWKAALKLQVREEISAQYKAANLTEEQLEVIASTNVEEIVKAVPEQELETKLKEGFNAWKQERLAQIATAKQALKAEADSRRAEIEKSLPGEGNLTRLVNIITLRRL